jgi:hypothetical protein
MFHKNLFRVADDPGRFCYAYISFLTESGSLDQLNKGYSAIRKVFKKYVRHTLSTTTSPTLTLQEKSGVQFVTGVEPSVNVEPPTEDSVPDKKRKLSLSTEAGPSKKIRSSNEENVPHRSFPTPSCFKAQVIRDREHATILAYNFPLQTTDDQVRFFFKDVGPLKFS